MTNRRDFLKRCATLAASFAALPILAKAATIDQCPPLHGDGINDDWPWLKWQMEHCPDGGTIQMPPGKFYMSQVSDGYSAGGSSRCVRGADGMRTTITGKPKTT